MKIKKEIYENVGTSAIISDIMVIIQKNGFGGRSLIVIIFEVPEIRPH